MARWWKESYDAKVHRNQMKGLIDGEYSYNFDFSKANNLQRAEVILVEVSQFTFSFLNLRQLELCRDYFGSKTHRSSRSVGGLEGADHWETQQWHDRLPKGLINSHNRPQVHKALCAAYEQFSKDRDYVAMLP